MEKLENLIDKTIERSFCLLFFLVPLILTPFNYELFEYNKMLLVYLFTAIIVAAWLIKMILQKRIIFTRTFLDLPLLIFLISQLLSYFFSIDRHTSFWGYYSRSHGGLASTFAYLCLYWAFVANMDLKKTLSALHFSLFAGGLVAGYGILEHFGIDKNYWVQDVQNRVFSTLGQPNWLAAYLVALLPLTWALTLETQKKKSKTALYFFLSVLFYLALTFTKSRSGFLGLSAAYLVFWGMIFLQRLLRRKKIAPLLALRQMPKTFFILTVVMILLSIIAGTPWTPKLEHLIRKPQAKQQASPIPAGGTESGEIRKIVWQGAIDVWRHYPLLGTGPETFAYSYYNFRPREHNDVSEWDFLYNKAHNEYLNFAANTGTLGLLAYLGVIGGFIFWSLKKIITAIRENKKISNFPRFYYFSLALLAGYASILVTNFFGFSVVVVGLLFFLYPAFAFVLSQEENNTKGIAHRNEKKSLDWPQKIFTFFFALCAIYFFLRLAQFWYADTLFAKGKKLNEVNQYNQAFGELQAAVQLNFSEPFYHDELAQSAASLAVAAHQQEEASLSAELTTLAISESDQTLKISPWHLNFWKNRTRVFYTLAEIDESYYQEALSSLLKAAEIAPTDAKVFYNLAVLYGRLGQNQTAIETLEKTIQLKPNYEAARWALALFYEQEGNLEKAKEELNYILEKINPNNQTVKEKLEEL